MNITINQVLQSYIDPLTASEYAALELEKAGLERLAPVLTGLPRGFPDRG